MKKEKYIKFVLKKLEELNIKLENEEGTKLFVRDGECGLKLLKPWDLSTWDYVEKNSVINDLIDEGVILVRDEYDKFLFYLYGDIIIYKKNNKTK